MKKWESENVQPFIYRNSLLKYKIVNSKPHHLLSYGGA